MERSSDVCEASASAHAGATAKVAMPLLAKRRTHPVDSQTDESASDAARDAVTKGEPQLNPPPSLSAPSVIRTVSPPKRPLRPMRLPLPLPRLKPLPLLLRLLQ